VDPRNAAHEQARANELELIWVKKKEKGKEAMLGVKEKKKKKQVLGRWRGEGSQLVRQQVH
jgi:hypothetical protein